MADNAFMDEQLRVEAAEAEAERRELEGLSPDERAAYYQEKAQRDAQKDDMLHSQLGVYGRSAVGGKKSRGAKKKDKEAAAKEKRDSTDRAEAEKEDRRQSRQRKLRELKEDLRDSDDEDTEQPAGSLLERLRAVKGGWRSTPRLSVRRRAHSGPLDAEPISVTVWIALLFGFALLDRSVKFASAHADPVLVSKALSSVIIVASFGVMVPQIMSVLEAKTVKGLSAIKFYTVVLSLTLHIAYSAAQSHPLTAYGDNISVLAQNLILVGLYWKFDKTPLPQQAALAGGFVAVVAALASATRVAKPEALWPLPLLATLLAHSGTVPQILANWENGHTGALSFVTQLMMFLGVVARVFTTLTETGDPIMVLSFLSSAIMSGVVLFQILMYWGNTKHVLAKEAAKRAKRTSN